MKYRLKQRMILRIVGVFSSRRRFLTPNFFMASPNSFMYFSTSENITLTICTSMFTRNMTGFDVKSIDRENKYRSGVCGNKK